MQVQAHGLAEERPNIISLKFFPPSADKKKARLSQKGKPLERVGRKATGPEKEGSGVVRQLIENVGPFLKEGWAFFVVHHKRGGEPSKESKGLAHT